MKYAFELDGVNYWYSGNILSQVPELKGSSGNMWLVTDMVSSVSRFMTVDAPPSSAEFVVRQKLQEAGEFDGPVTVIPHMKKKAGSSATDILFTALPTNIYNEYTKRVRESNDAIMLFPIYEILLGILRKKRGGDYKAVIFQHNRFADIIIGAGDKVVYANRCVAFSTEEEQIEHLWDAVKKDIETVEQDHRIKVAGITLLTWIDSSPIPDRADTFTEKVQLYPAEEIIFDKERPVASFIRAVKKQSATSSVSPGLDKIAYYAERILPLLNILIFIAILGLAGGGTYFRDKANAQKETIHSLESRMYRADDFKPVALSDDFKDTLSFVREVYFSKNAPSFKQIVNDISSACATDMIIEVMKIDYAKNAVRLEIYGHVNASFDQAHKGYQRFLLTMKAIGYSVQENRFDTDIKASTFLLKLTRRIS